MTLTPADYAVIVAFFAINLGIGLYFARRGGRSVSEFFLSGRNVPWWLAGISMVATTFGADTPLAVTGLVVQHGIAGNWLWWSAVMSGILTVFFFAKLWRRSGVLTDVEFIELRYSGGPAAVLRFVRAFFQGVFVNTVIMGWVNLAMIKILELTLHVNKYEALAGCLIFTAVYVSIGGLWGVLVTDLLQFAVKMSMAVVLAVAVVAAIGGIGALESKIALIDATHKSGGGSLLAFFPTSNEAWLPLLTFVSYIAVQWWASSYPGAEPGGGGYIAQRIFSARSENDSLLATLFFNVAHYALRPWPWILVALSALVLYPHGVKGPDGKVDVELGYIQAMIDYLPAWLRGLMLAGFLAAYMSTIGTHLNLGAAYLTNDIYKRFINPDAAEGHYVVVSRIATLIVMVLAVIGALANNSVSGAWQYLYNLTAGVGLVMILRWYWWRVNAWSEISALLASFFVSNALIVFKAFAGDPNQTAIILMITVVATTVVWIAVTLFTPPEPQESLVRFYERVRPSAAGWGGIPALAKPGPGAESLAVNAIDWLAGCGLVYGALFGIGKVVLGDVGIGIAYLAGASLCGALIAYNVARAERADAKPATATS